MLNKGFYIMGTQIHIKTVDLLKSGCTVTFSGEWHKYDPVFNDEAYSEIRALITVPITGQTFYMNACEDLDSVWSDWNNWGSNKSYIKPKLDSLTIPVPFVLGQVTL